MPARYILPVRFTLYVHPENPHSSGYYVCLMLLFSTLFRFMHDYPCFSSYSAKTYPIFMILE